MSRRNLILSATFQKLLQSNCMSIKFHKNGLFVTSVTYTDWKVTTSSLLLSNSPFLQSLQCCQLFCRKFQFEEKSTFIFFPITFTPGFLVNVVSENTKNYQSLLSSSDESSCLLFNELIIISFTFGLGSLVISVLMAPVLPKMYSNSSDVIFIPRKLWGPAN